MKPVEVSKNAQRIKYIAADLVSGALAFWVFNIVRFLLLKEIHTSYISVWNYLGITKIIIEQCLFPVGMLVIYWLTGFYNQPFRKSRLQELNITLFSAFINTVIIYLLLLTNDQTGRRSVNYELIIILFGLLFIITYVGRLIITQRALHQFRKDHWHVNVLILGNSRVSRKVAKTILNQRGFVAYNLKGFVEIPGEHSVKDKQTVYPFENLEALLHQLEINQVILAPENKDDKKVMKLLSVLFPMDISVKISPDTFSFVTSAIRLRDIYGEPFIDLTGPSLGEGSKNIKRTFDVAMSVVVLIILSPFLGVLALLVKFTSKGPVIFTQERTGLHQKPFRIFKFRTMVENAEQEGPQLSQDNDPRITPIGRWMRKYRLDELPQFWNVLKGDMSIVGPRPEREYYIRQIIQKAPYYTLICQVRPGITSWGMVKYGYASSVSQMVERTRYDLLYLSNMSLSLDCKILIYTVKTIFGGEGK